MSIENLLSELTAAVKELTATIREANASPNYTPAEYTPDVEMPPTLVDLPDVGADHAPTLEQSAEPMTAEEFNDAVIGLGPAYKSKFGASYRNHYVGVLASFGLDSATKATPEQRRPLLDALKNYLEANNV